MMPRSVYWRSAFLLAFALVLAALAAVAARDVGSATAQSRYPVGTAASS